jgi:hypothetical protein
MKTFNEFLNEETVTFSIDDGGLDDKFLGNSALSKNLDYADVMGDTYYVLPKRDFDRLLDFGDSDGYDIEKIINVIDENEKLY